MKAVKYTLITGASSGLGREFCMQCAERKMNLIMIALPNSNTDSLAHELRLEYGVDIQVYEFDLTDSILLQEHINLIRDLYEVNFIINNAGIGGTAAITQSSSETIDRIMQVNIRSMVLITQGLLPVLLKQERSYVLNISSMAAFTPIAYKTVYPASKAFISSFSLGLREELAGTGVSVSVVYPGPIMTNSSVSARIVSQSTQGRLGLMPTARIVQIALKKTLAGRAVIIPGVWNRFNYGLMRVLPTGTKLKIVSKAVKKEMVVNK
ncbi:SDR family NAD(P)-dependent oxidoreductase [Pedobacter deserti]|uniref:SDR family NAD(P)-dependent oxidoreductase n=1 Tax=Pedobacter deserti TaxID=2817382 RepID=UPI002109C656|nr:SDR family NAD(P)-dependent oxidoreductase [Pedobacter sp. SYSU D00382]